MDEKRREGIEELRGRIALLPTGGLTNKTIRGKVYTYYQWSENGKQRSRTVKGDEIDRLKTQIEERKKLQERLRSLEIAGDAGLGKYEKNKTESSGKTTVSEFRRPLSRTSNQNDNNSNEFYYSITPSGGEVQSGEPFSYNRQPVTTEEYITNVRVGKSLVDFSLSVKNYKKRELYCQIEKYVYGDTYDKVLILYGLRRTGKTTLIRQILYNMKDEYNEKAAFIQVNVKNTLAEINKDLRKLESSGYKYVFIDEVTLLDDFIEGAALFSDVYAGIGMKIVLSGTDSLGFVFSEDEQLYDRCIFLHTTFIPFREFERVLDIHDIDEYMRFGGTMSQSGENYNREIFGSKKSTDEYVNTAIARNIQHSLRNYQFEGHFRSLKELYERNELSNVINRIVEDMNHDFTIGVLTRAFRSHDFGSAKNIMRKDRNNPTDILDDIDEKKLTVNLMKLLEIKNKEEQNVEIKDIHRKEIKEYFNLLDLTSDIPLVDMSDLNTRRMTTVFSQPGLRYSQAESLVKTLMMDETFRGIGAVERKRITDRILEDIMGRMLEEIVQLETKKANPNLEVFKLQFAVGEFDMVIFDPVSVCCKLYEVKHSREKDPSQYRHLVNKNLCMQTEFRYGTILEKVVLYRGESCEVENGICYKNVEEYLKEINTP